MPKNENNEEICVAEVAGYSTCGFERMHPIHMHLGANKDLEHDFKPDGEIEETLLKKKNIGYIASRSNKTVEELQAMLLMAKKQGRKITVRYKVEEK